MAPENQASASASGLAVLPDGLVVATGQGDGLGTRELPLALAPVSVEMVWHLRQDGDAAHRWLRAQVQAAVTAAAAA